MGEYGQYGEYAVLPDAGTRHGRRADGLSPGSAASGVRPHRDRIGVAAAGHASCGDRAGRGPGRGSGAGGTAPPGRAERIPCPVSASRGPRASVTPRRKAVP